MYSSYFTFNLNLKKSISKNLFLTGHLHPEIVLYDAPSSNRVEKKGRAFFEQC